MTSLKRHEIANAIVASLNGVVFKPWHQTEEGEDVFGAVMDIKGIKKIKLRFTLKKEESGVFMNIISVARF